MSLSQCVALDFAFRYMFENVPSNRTNPVSRVMSLRKDNDSDMFSIYGPALWLLAIATVSYAMRLVPAFTGPGSSTCTLV